MLPLALVDLPLSLVADTIILPYTIAKNATTKSARPPAQRNAQHFEVRTFAPPEPRGASFSVRLSQYTHANEEIWLTMLVRSTGKEVSVVLRARDGTRLLATQPLAANRNQEVRTRLRGPALRGWKDVRVQAVTTTGETFDVEHD